MKLNNFIFNKAIPVTLFFCLSLISTAQAQATLQVATKKIERTIGAPAVRTLFINAEKADIEMVTWGKDDISVVMELSAKQYQNTKGNTGTTNYKSRFAGSKLDIVRRWSAMVVLFDVE